MNNVAGIAYQGCCRGCSFFFGAILGSLAGGSEPACGGASVPSTLKALALRSRSVIASRVGTFLNPRAGLEAARAFAPVVASSAVTAGAVVRLRRSRCSVVSSFPEVAVIVPPSLFDPVGELDRCEEGAGEVERVVGGRTVVDSAALELLVTETWLDVVRASRDVGSRERAAPELELLVLAVLDDSRAAT